MLFSLFMKKNLDNIGELSKRILVSAALIPIGIFIMYIGGAAYFVALELISAITLWEFYAIAERKNIEPLKIYGVASGAIFQALFYYFYIEAAIFELFVAVFVWLVFFFLITLAIQLFKENEGALNNVSVTIFGVLYIPVLMSSLVGVREFDKLHIWIVHYAREMGATPDMSSVLSACGYDFWGRFAVFLFLTVWITDSFAYFLGVKFGKRKLAPTISKHKSWEGAIAGFAGALVSGAFISAALIPEFPRVHAIVVSVFIGVLGMVGDLAESQLKRDANVKDSSSILPGHGGFLDRFDGLIYLVSVVYMYLIILAIF